jgi:hypothetical protein
MSADPVALSPCPLCGGKSGYSLSDGSTFRWWEVACKDCGEQIGECRSDQGTKLDAPKPERWVQADLHWNEAAAHAQGLRDRIESLEAEIARLHTVIRRSATIMAGGEGVQDQGEAWDRTLRLLDDACAAIDAALASEAQEPKL